ncbi:MAG: MFS transporter [Spirochaetales bacterium]|nr:MFS transporter [Spirochaetales bacterium]
MKRTFILFPAAFLMNMNLALVNFAVIFYLKDSLNIEASIIGWYFAAGAVCYVAGCMLMRPVQNRIIPPVAMFIAILLTIFSVFMILKAESPGVVLVFYLLFSFSPAFYWPQLMGWFSYGLDNSGLGSAISKFNISWSTGSLSGPLVGGLLVERNLLFPFYADIILMTSLGLLLAFGLVFVRDMRSFPVHSEPANSLRSADEMINGGRGTILRFAGWIGVFSTYIVLGLLNNIFPLFIRDNMGLGESVAGNLLFLRGVTTAIGFFIAGKITSWHFNSKLMLLTQILTAVSMLILLMVKSITGFYGLFIFYGLLFAMAYSNGIFHGSAGAVDRGRRMGLFESILTMGVIVGSLLGGYFYQYYSIYTAFLFCFALITIGFTAQLVLVRFGRKNELR